MRRVLPLLATMALLLACGSGGPVSAKDEPRGAVKSLQDRINDIGTLASVFAEPPQSSGAWVYWHWMGSNYSKEGITRDLEEMKRWGICGAMIFNLTSQVEESHKPTANNPWPERTYRSPAYWDAVRHAAAEGKRLGIEIILHNSVGYSATGGPWIDEPRGMRRLLWSETVVQGGTDVRMTLPKPVIPPYGGWGKTGRVFTDYADLRVIAVPDAKKTVGMEEVLDLTEKMTAAGDLNWTAPAGKWRIYRIGDGPTGASLHPVPDELLGNTLEVNKMDEDMTRYHWEQVIGPLKKELGDLAGPGGGLTGLYTDSYEAGFQTWTRKMVEEFKAMRGYDPTPFLVTLSSGVTGKPLPATRFVVSEEHTKRFDWDYRDVLSRLMQERHWKVSWEVCHEAGLSYSQEPYGGQVDPVFGGALVDLPGVEFWTSGDGGVSPDVLAGARAAGKPIVFAEAFTGSPGVSKWNEHPAMLKHVGDLAFANGVNRFVLHHWVHQPFDEKYKPGMTMGWWGTHFGENQTWAEPGRAWMRYVSRCQAMLQAGEQVVDFVCVERSQMGGDAITRSEFLSGRVRVENGKIVLPSGRRYAFLVMPGGNRMLPEVLAEVGRLVGAGATVVADRPDASPSLQGYPRCDEQVREMAEKVWASGRVKPTSDLATVWQEKTGGASVHVTNVTGGDTVIVKRKDKEVAVPKVRAVHRKIADGSGATDVVFVVNSMKDSLSTTVSIRGNSGGRVVELWNAETGEIRPAPIWRDVPGATEVDLSLGGEDSVFVVIRPGSPSATHAVRAELEGEGKLMVKPDGSLVIRSAGKVKGTVELSAGKKVTIEKAAPPAAVEVTGPWSVDFGSAFGGVGKAEFTNLVSWSESTEKNIKYFSGTAVYRKSVEVSPGWLGTGRRVILDLGQVENLATVKVNGKPLGVLWRAPFRVDVTEAMREGSNELEVAVTNTWANRLIGDEQEPDDLTWAASRGDRGRGLAAYPEWFVKNLPRPSQGRLGFSVWNYFTKESKLLPAGLLGPVKIVTENEYPVTP
jgi:hypothetical protein